MTHFNTKAQQVIKYFENNPSFFFWIILLVNFVTRFMYLDNQSFWFDEVSTIYWSMHSYREIFDISMQDPNGPVYQFILRTWILLFGFSEYSVRAVPAIFACLTLWPVYKIGKTFFNRQVAFVAILLLTFSNVFLHYAQENRSYSLIVFLSTWSFYFFMQILKEGKGKYLIGYVLLTTTVLFTHLTASLIMVAQFAGSLFYLRSDFKKVVVSYIGMAIPTISIGIWLLNNSWIGGGETVWLPVPTLKSIWNVLKVFFNFKYTLFFSGTTFVFYILYHYRFKLKIENWKEILIMVLWGTVPIAITYLGSIYYNPRFLPRYMLYVLPGLYLSVSVFMVMGIKQGWLKLALSSILILLMVFSFEIKQDKAELWRKAVAFHNKYKTEESFTVLCTHYQMIPFSYYYDKDIFADFKNMDMGLHAEKIFLLCDGQQLAQTVEWEPQANRIILFLAHEKMLDSEGTLLKYADENFVLVKSETNLKGLRVFVFDKEGTSQASEIDLGSLAIEQKEYNDILISEFSDIGYDTLSFMNLSCTIKSEVAIPEARLIMTTRSQHDGNSHINPFLSNVIPNEPYHFEGTLELPQGLPEKGDVAIYIWQPKEKNKFKIEDIKIEFK